MTLYMFTALLIAVPGFFYGSRTKRDIMLKDRPKQMIKLHSRLTVSVETLHFVVCVFLLAFMMANRGAFSTDTANYQSMFEESARISSFSDLMSYTRTEPGFILLNKLVRTFTDNYYWMQVVDTLITIIPIAYICSFSPNRWLSLFIYFIFGTYFQAFNVVRQMMAASIMMIGIEGLYNSNAKKYFVATIVGSLMHTTTLLMIPMYFIINFSKKSVKWWQYVLINVVLSNFIIIIASQYQLYFNNSDWSTGKELAGYGQSIVYLPIFLVGLFAILFWLDKHGGVNRSSAERTILNISLAGSIMWCMCYLLCVQLSYAIRITGFFLPFIMIGLPSIIDMQKNRNVALLAKLVICLVGLLYFAQANGAHSWIPIW